MLESLKVIAARLENVKQQLAYGYIEDAARLLERAMQELDAHLPNPRQRRASDLMENVTLGARAPDPKFVLELREDFGDRLPGGAR